MKDYSLNLEERKDFILRYDVTEDKMIKIIFAKGEPWYVPYNKENEDKILKKMEKQLENAEQYEKNIKKKFACSLLVFAGCIGAALFPMLQMTGGENFLLYASLSSVSVGASLIPLGYVIKNNSKFKDLQKNIQFLEMKEKLNEVARSDENKLVNILVDVSKKTKDVIEDFPKDRDVFDINSFNYVPFKDLEQIMENVARNERFGFDYAKQEEPEQAIVRKRVR